MKNEKSTAAVTLRRKAEKKIKTDHPENLTSLSGGDILKLMHELEVHQIELEMQNEELRQAKFKAEDAAKNFADLYNEIYSYSPAGYFNLAPDGRIINVNNNGALILGKERFDLVQSNFRLFISPASLPVFNEFLQKAFDSNCNQACELNLAVIGKPSCNVFIEGRVPAHKEECLLTAFDITERKLAEEALLMSESKYRRLHETMNDGFAMVNMNGKIIEFNQPYREMLGYSDEELYKLTYNDITPPKWHDSESRIVAEEILPKGFSSVYEKEYIRKDGTIVPVELRTFLIKNEKNDNEGMWAIVRDITDRKETEKIIHENETRLRELNATKDKFFSIIAHDLKNPFNSIIGFSNILAEQVRELDLCEIEEYAGIIQRSSKRAMELLTNLLEWSRLQTGRLEFNPQNIDLIVLIEHEIDLLSDTASLKSITISKKTPKNVKAIADKFMIETVLRNLISNAIKFSHRGGEITVSVVQKINELEIAVADKGVGIKSESIVKLFRIEESYSTAGTQNEKGTGLGLILCREFIEKHKGRIWVESEIEKGSTFRFSIPLI